MYWSLWSARKVLVDLQLVPVELRPQTSWVLQHLVRQVEGATAGGRPTPVVDELTRGSFLTSLSDSFNSENFLVIVALVQARFESVFTLFNSLQVLVLTLTVPLGGTRQSSPLVTQYDTMCLVEPSNHFGDPAVLSVRLVATRWQQRPFSSCFYSYLDFSVTQRALITSFFFNTCSTFWLSSLLFERCVLLQFAPRNHNLCCSELKKEKIIKGNICAFTFNFSQICSKFNAHIFRF